MTELASKPAAGDIGAEIDKALLEKNRAIDEDANENVDSPSTEEPPKTEPKEDAVQKRFDKLTREKYDARRKADLAEYRNRELETRLAALEAKPAQARPAEPTLESVGFDEAKYRKELTEYLKKEAIAAAREAAKETISASQAQRQHSEFDQRQAEFAKENPDYIEKVLERETLPISAEMQDALMQMETGPQIALYLCSNEDKAREIMALPPLLQAREIGRIEAALEKKAPRTQISQAPPPPAKLEATESPKELDMNDSSKWNDKQYLKWRLSAKK